MACVHGVQQHFAKYLNMSYYFNLPLSWKGRQAWLDSPPDHFFPNAVFFHCARTDTVSAGETQVHLLTGTRCQRITTTAMSQHQSLYELCTNGTCFVDVSHSARYSLQNVSTLEPRLLFIYLFIKSNCRRGLLVVF